MARSYSSVLNQMERERQRGLRELERAQRARERHIVAEAKEQKRHILEARVAGVEEMNRDLDQRINDLKCLLVKALTIPSAINFEKLKVKPQSPTLHLGHLEHGIPPPQMSQFEPKKPHFLVSWIPQQKQAYGKRVEQAQRSFDDARIQHAKSESERQVGIARLRDECEKAFEASKAEVSEPAC